jgi:hypothetical protein
MTLITIDILSSATLNQIIMYTVNRILEKQNSGANLWS